PALSSDEDVDALRLGQHREVRRQLGHQLRIAGDRSGDLLRHALVALPQRLVDAERAEVVEDRAARVGVAAQAGRVIGVVRQVQQVAHRLLPLRVRQTRQAARGRGQLVADRDEGVFAFAFAFAFAHTGREPAGAPGIFSLAFPFAGAGGAAAGTLCFTG